MFITDLPFEKQSAGPITIAAVGCGARAHAYLAIAKEMLPDRYTVVAGADPKPECCEVLRQASENPDFQAFDSADALLEQPRLADVLIISTQDNYHFEPCKKAIEKGYHILLEKPIAQTVEETTELARLAKLHNRRVVICFVLRYTPYYQKLKEIVDSGRLGQIISLTISEGVEPWHQVHSFVRGHWAVESESTPMIVAKSCHYMDIMAWLLNDSCKTLTSMGDLSFYNKEHMPEGATPRCTDGCPHVGKCMYDAHRYATDMRDPWLRVLLTNWKDMTDEEVYDWLKTSKWGRCAWQCDNDVVDHQVVAMTFEKGVTATFTMTAFSSGDNIQIYGTKGVLKTGLRKNDETGCNFCIIDHATSDFEKINIDLSAEHLSEHEVHGGGDFGLVNAMDHLFKGEPGTENGLIATAIEGHLMCFAAEESRINDGKRIDMSTYHDMTT